MLAEFKKNYYYSFDNIQIRGYIIKFSYLYAVAAL